MFPRQTVFVLGAGASCDLGLPSGDQLRQKLVEVLRRDGDNLRFTNDFVNRAIRTRAAERGGNAWVQVFERYLDAGLRIRAGLPLAISIDNFLDAHRNDEILRELGKIAITNAILDAERNSALSQGSLGTVGGVDWFTLGPKLEGSWYLPLMRLLTVGKSVEDVPGLFENVAFIVFNYDRCLEQFLVNAVMAYFNVPPHVAIESVRRLQVIHPYGRVGYLAWQGQPLSASFGNVGTDLWTISQGIQTFTESSDEGVVNNVKGIIRTAETIVFMGYGFHQQNNDLLSVEQSNVRRVFCTTMDISDTDIPIVTQEIYKIIAKQEPEVLALASNSRYARIFIERSDCSALMKNHRFRLSRPPVPLGAAGEC